MNKKIEQQQKQLKQTALNLEEQDAQMKSDSRNIVSMQQEELLSIAQDLQKKNESIKSKTNSGFESMTNSFQSPTEKTIDEKKVRELRAIFDKYKEGKRAFDERAIKNNEWWIMRHYGQMSTKGEAQSKKKQNEERASAWLFNSLDNKHADYMDSYPEAVCLPQEHNDTEDAMILTKIIPAVLESNNYEQTYSDAKWTKEVIGASCNAVLWDSSKLNGLGDISIKEINLLNLAWKPGIENIQESPYLFYVNKMDNKEIVNIFKDRVENIENRLSANASDTVNEYIKEDYYDDSEQSLVFDCFYKVKNQNGKTVVHYIKWVNDVLLFASENEGEYKETGYYNHGLYPFVIDKMFPVKNSPVGFGYVDVMSPTQAIIDEMDAVFVANAKRSAKTRYVASKNAGVNIEQLADFDQDIIEASSNNLDEGNFREITTRPLSGICTSFRADKIEELKATSNNREFSNGGTANGITAASAIAALQEAGSKTSRDEIRSSYRAFAQEVYLVIELIRQFYDEKRTFRIVGENGERKFVTYNNANIKGTDENSRVPVFDIRVKPEKRSPYSRAAQNEMMINLFQMGVFNPQLADQATLLVENLEFEGKEDLLQRISQNGNLFNSVLQYQNVIIEMAKKIDAMQGTQDFTEAAINAIEANQPEGLPNMIGSPSASNFRSDESSGNAIVDRARANVRNAIEVSR